MNVLLLSVKISDDFIDILKNFTIVNIHFSYSLNSLSDKPK
jgi:hypothetical protein